MSFARSPKVNFHVHDVLNVLKPFMWIVTPLLLISTTEATTKSNSNSNSDTDYSWRFKNQEGIAYKGEFEDKCWFEEFVQRAIAECNAISRKADLSKLVYDEVTCSKFGVYKIGRYDKQGDSTFEDCFCDVMKEADKYCTEQGWITAGYTLAGIAAFCCCVCICFAGYFCVKSGMVNDCFESMSNQIINARQRVTNSVQSGWNSALSVFQPAAQSPNQGQRQPQEMRSV